MVFVLLLVSLLAVALVVGTLWWTFLRPGRLTAVRPSTYATPPGATLHVRFPLVFVNDGARPQVVADLRLRVAGDHELHWASVRSKVSPSMDDFVDSAGAFVVDGRSARRMFLEFGQVPPEWRPEPGGTYPLVLERMDASAQWQPLLEFDWHAPGTADLMASGVAHRNVTAGGPLL